jgi:hypothetical protein
LLFNNEYRGDLIVTDGVLYYFAHTNVSDARHRQEIGRDEKAEIAVDTTAALLPGGDGLVLAINYGTKIVKFIRRACFPTTNSPQIRKLKLWSGRADNVALQAHLDNYIDKLKNQKVNFAEDAVPKPLRFEAGEVINLSLGLKLKFDAKSDTHDFRVHLFHRNRLKTALNAAGFIK